MENSVAVMQAELCPIRIDMLGRFALSYDGDVMLEDEGRMHKVWSLLAYLIANHDRKLEPQELPELLCSDERSNDPMRAVKNLVYRLRCLLADSQLPEANYIVQKGGIYGWNSDIPYEIDAELFVNFYKQAEQMDSHNIEGKLDLYLKAIDLYKGKFLPRSAYDEWSVSLSTYYQRIYIEAIRKAYGLMEWNQDFSKMIEICEKAIEIDPYDEDLYIIYIKSLISESRHKDALSAYDSIVNRLYSELGVNPSKELSLLYREIIKTIKSVETDLLAIKADLNEEGAAEGSYYCEYEIFKDIYRFIARGVERTGASIFIMLCTLTDKNDEIPSIEHLGDAMETLKTVVGRALRKGDLFARYSNSQYVLMLPGTSYENGCMIGERIIGAYKKNRISGRVKLHYKLQPLDPKMD